MRLGQSNRHAIVETVLGTSIGYLIALGTQLIFFPLYGIELSPVSNVSLSLIFTVVSFVRSYAIRRLFNWLHVKDIL